MMDLAPGANFSAHLVQRAGREFVAALIQITQIGGESEEETQLLQFQIGLGQHPLAPSGIGRLDQPLQHVKRRGLDTVDQQKFLAGSAPWTPEVRR